MIKVCDGCSRVDLQVLKTIVPEEALKVGCVGHCEGHDGKSFGIIHGELVIVDDENAFIEAVKNAL